MQATKESNQSETTTSLELVTLKPLRMFERRLMSSSVILASFANPKDASMYLSSSFLSSLLSASILRAGRPTLPRDPVRCTAISLYGYLTDASSRKGNIPSLSCLEALALPQKASRVLARVTCPVIRPTEDFTKVSEMNSVRDCRFTLRSAASLRAPDLTMLDRRLRIPRASLRTPSFPSQSALRSQGMHSWMSMFAASPNPFSAPAPFPFICLCACRFLATAWSSILFVITEFVEDRCPLRDLRILALTLFTASLSSLSLQL
mmetsp:Transcript_7583/g.27492  ORF Transcript_7583/g.27492 Transcript_7583/m.27492 type:complete len:263 (+) Transcript_7583:4091-4879(+)